MASAGMVSPSPTWQEGLFSSAIGSFSSGKRTNSGLRFRGGISSLRCSSAHEVTPDETPTRRNNASLGTRREALLSLVAAGVSIPPSLSGFEVSKHERERGEAAAATERGAKKVPAMENLVELAVFDDAPGVAPISQAGVTSNYVRPAAASPDLPLQSLLQTSNTSGVIASATPSQVYISLYGPNRMQVSWITSSSGDASTVDYGTSAGAYTATATGTSSLYTYKGYTSGNIHYVVIGPLQNNTTYFYRMGGLAPEFSFKTPPPAGPEVPINFAVVGDLGQTSNTQSTLQHISQKAYDVFILPGDLSYADGEQPRWDSYGQLVSPLASSRPWMVTEGNHEIESARGIEDFRAYNARWKMPYALSGSNSNLYYSFEVAGVHFLMLGSYTDYSQDSDQYKWLQNDLAKVNRSKTPWLIGVIHAPWYNSNFAHLGEGDDMLAAMEDLLFEAKVDIVFAGHVHAYERSVRTYKGKPNNCGILYLTIGDGGNREGLARLYLPQPRWSAFREASYGHGELNIKSSTSAVWTWHRNQDDEAIVADSVEITSLSSSTQCGNLKPLLHLTPRLL